MRYQHDIIIDLPLAKVIELFDNPENLKHWQPGFISIEHFEGRPGEPGSKARLKYDMNGRQIEMIETITNRNLPHEFDGTYEAPNIVNHIWNRFETVDGDRTRWTSENEFKFSGLMRFLAFLMPNAFKKQSYQYMVNFKAFAERG